MNKEYYTNNESIFGSWHIVREIGRGSNSAVFEIVREEFGSERCAALKVISIPQDDSEWENFALTNGATWENTYDYYSDLVKRYEKEISLMEKVKGCSFIAGYEETEIKPHDDGKGWDILIRMELLTPLRKYIDTHGGKLDSDTVKKLALDLCAALEICEKNGIVHRDIRPENIFVSEIGYFKLGDFGMARINEATTGASTRIGIDDYLAPEIINRSSEYDSRADIYSLGMTMYRLLNGNRLPFEPDDTSPAYMRDKTEAKKQRLSGAPFTKPKYADAFISDIILRACKYKKEDRFASASEMKRALKGEIGVIDPPPGSDGPKPPNPEEYFINATCSKHGEINPKGKTSVRAGDSFTIEFNPHDGYYVSSIEIDGTAFLDLGESYTFKDVNRNHSISVNFEKKVESPAPKDNKALLAFIIIGIIVAILLSIILRVYGKRDPEEESATKYNYTEPNFMPEEPNEEKTTEEFGVGSGKDVTENSDNTVIEDNEKLDVYMNEDVPGDISSSINQVINNDTYSDLPSILPVDRQIEPSDYDDNNEWVLFDTPLGTNVIATGAGFVTYAGPTEEIPGYFVIIIDHDNGYASNYYCRSSPIIKEGVNVDRGTILYDIEIEDDRLIYRVLYEGNYINPYTLFNISK